MLQTHLHAQKSQTLEDNMLKCLMLLCGTLPNDVQFLLLELPRLIKEAEQDKGLLDNLGMYRFAKYNVKEVRYLHPLC